VLPISNSACVRTKKNAWEIYRDVKIPIFDDLLGGDSFFKKYSGGAI